MIGKFALCAGSALIAAPAFAGADSDAVKKFGLVGIWAQDCAAPPTGTNAYVLYTAPDDGPPTETLVMAGARVSRTSKMSNVRIVSPTKLAYSMTSRAGDLNLVLLMKDGRNKTWSSVKSDGSETYIRDGRFRETKGESPWFTRCKE